MLDLWSKRDGEAGNWRGRENRLNVNKPLDYDWATSLERTVLAFGEQTVKAVLRCCPWTGIASGHPHTSAHTLWSVRMRQGWGLGDAFHIRYCLCQEVLSWFSFYLLTFTDSKPIQKIKEKKQKRKEIIFLLQWRYRFTEASWKSSLTGESLPPSEAASFLWVRDANKGCVFKGGSNLKHCATHPTVMYGCFKTIDFSPSPHLRRSLDLLRKYINIVTMLCC